MHLRGMFSALERLCLGFESNGAGAARRARAAALGAIPAIVDAVASEFSEDLFKKGLSTAFTIAGAGKGVAPHEEDRALKAQWDRAVAKHPDLQRKLTEKADRSDVEALIRAQVGHLQAELKRAGAHPTNKEAARAPLSQARARP